MQCLHATVSPCRCAMAFCFMYVNQIRFIQMGFISHVMHDYAGSSAVHPVSNAVCSHHLGLSFVVFVAAMIECSDHHYGFLSALQPG